MIPCVIDAGQSHPRIILVVLRLQPEGRPVFNARFSGLGSRASGAPQSPTTSRTAWTGPLSLLMATSSGLGQLNLCPVFAATEEVSVRWRLRSLLSHMRHEAYENAGPRHDNRYGRNPRAARRTGRQRLPPYCAAPCVWMNVRTRLTVRSFRSGGDFHGKTVISAFGASEATSTDVWWGCDGTSSGSTRIGV